MLVVGLYGPQASAQTQPGDFIDVFVSEGSGGLAFPQA
jgi:hypothetical protein